MVAPQKSINICFWSSALAVVPALTAFAGGFFAASLPCGIGITCSVAANRPTFDLYGTAPLLALTLLAISCATLFGSTLKGARKPAEALALGGLIVALAIVMVGWVQYRFVLTYHVMTGVGFAVAVLSASTAQRSEKAISPWVRVSALVACTLGSLGFAHGHRRPPLYSEANLSDLRWESLVGPRHHGLGPQNPRRAVIVFADLTCGVSHQALQEFIPLARKGEGARLVMHHTLLQPNGEARELALAAESSPNNDRFWAFLEDFARMKSKPDVKIDRLYAKYPWASPSMRGTKADADLLKDLSLSNHLRIAGSPIYLIADQGESPRPVTKDEAIKALKKDS